MIEHEDDNDADDIATVVHVNKIAAWVPMSADLYADFGWDADPETQRWRRELRAMKSERNRWAMFGFTSRCRYESPDPPVAWDPKLFPRLARLEERCRAAGVRLRRAGKAARSVGWAARHPWLLLDELDRAQQEDW